MNPNQPGRGEQGQEGRGEYVRSQRGWWGCCGSACLSGVQTASRSLWSSVWRERGGGEGDKRSKGVLLEGVGGRGNAFTFSGLERSSRWKEVETYLTDAHGHLRQVHCMSRVQIFQFHRRQVNEYINNKSVDVSHAACCTTSRGTIKEAHGDGSLRACSLTHTHTHTHINEPQHCQTGRTSPSVPRRVVVLSVKNRSAKSRLTASAQPTHPAHAKTTTRPANKKQMNNQRQGEGGREGENRSPGHLSCVKAQTSPLAPLRRDTRA